MADIQRCVVLDRRRYYVHLNRSSATIPRTFVDRFELSGDLLPVTIIHWSEAVFDEQALQSTCLGFSHIDDVWTPAFASHIILVCPKARACIVKLNHVFVVDHCEFVAPNGPYVLDVASGQLCPVSLLVDDPSLAFVHGLVATGTDADGYCPVSTSVGIPLPSRLYSEQGSRTLAGLRFAVKDAIAVKGIQTGFGNASWHETYPAAVKTAPCIQTLVDAGAQLVGLVKTTEFAEGVDPCEWLDTVCPFNPRGDGHQKASSSSAGSAVAAAAYSWLDFTVGTDTGGSIRHPAGVQGLFGQRCSSALANLEGVLGATDLFNTVGIFAREVDIFCRAGSQILGRGLSTHGSPQRPKFNLLYPTRAEQLTNPDQHHGGQHRWFPHPDVDRSTWSEAEKLIETVMGQLERALDCRRIPMNINELWRVTPPVGQSKSLDEAVGSIYSVVTTSSAVHTFADGFADDYAAGHGGAQPRISPLVQRRLDHGRRISGHQFATALESMRAFSQWAETMLFEQYDQEAMTLLIFPQSCGRPEYRDEVPDFSELFNDTFSIYSFGYLMGCPDYTIPVGEVSFVSKITKQEEFLPVSISLIGKPGTDSELFQLIRSLNETGIIRDVVAGPRLYI